MKRHILFIIAFLVCSTGMVTAQELTQNNFSIGPRIGLNLSNVNHPDAAKMLPGLVAGVTSTYSINENSGITVDLLYSGEGYKIGDEKFNLNYLRIPLLYNIFFGELGESFRPKVFLGPQAGFLLSAEAGGVDVKDNVKNFSFGLGAGLGFNYQLQERVWLNTDLRSFFDLTSLDETTPVNDEKSRIQNIQLSVGIAWGL